MAKKETLLRRWGRNAVGAVAGTLADTPARQKARGERQARIAKIGFKVAGGATVLTIVGLVLVPKVAEVVSRSVNPDSTPLSPPVLNAPIDLNGIVYCERPGEAGPTKDGNVAVCEYAKGCIIPNQSYPALFEHSINANGKISEYPLSCNFLRKEDLGFEPKPTAGISEKLLEQPDSASTPLPEYQNVTSTPSPDGIVYNCSNPSYQQRINKSSVWIDCRFLDTTQCPQLQQVSEPGYLTSSYNNKGVRKDLCTPATSIQLNAVGAPINKYGPSSPLYRINEK